MNEARYDIILYDSDTPYRYFITKFSGYDADHWHSSCEILFVLSGQISITVDNVAYTLYEEDIIVINSDSIHHLNSEFCELVILHMDLNRICLFNSASDSYYVCCSATRRRDYADYNYIRYLIARMIQINFDSTNVYKTMSLIYMIINELNTSFSERHIEVSASDKHSERIRVITTYIKHHFRENITLSDLAKSIHLTDSYLSKFFKKYLGTNFTDYYNNIRLEHAVSELVSGDATIETIAVNCGFSDSRAFVSAFKKHYGIRPSEYRKEYIKNASISSKPTQSSAKWEVIEIAESGKLEKLSKFLQLFHSEVTVSDNRLKSIDCGTINFNTSLSTLHHNFRSMVTINSAKLLLHSSVQKMVIKAQKEIGFKYLSFHGLLSDDMMVYGENRMGEPIYSFLYINEVFDFITNNHLKPFVRLNYMPSLLAASAKKNVFYKKEAISKPKNMKLWKALIIELFKNLFIRYGVKEVLTWPVSIWNEPATSIFGFDNDEDFFLFYVETYKTIKEINPFIKIGAPPTTYLYDDWISKFFKYIEDNNCPPDFIDIHYYDDGAATAKKLDEDPESILKYFNNISDFNILNDLNINEDSFFLYLNDFKKAMKTFGYSRLPHFMSEWNLTISSRNLINDTCYKSCYIAKNLLENYDRLDSFGYWNLTDYYEEKQLPPNLYHGGFGLLTMNGIPKSSYNVLRLLKHLGSTFLGRGDGWFATKEEQKVIFVFYNYEHFPELLVSGKLSDMINTQQYIPFFNKQDAIAKVHLFNLPGSKCTIKEFFINRENGSSFDTWVRMGAETLNNEGLSLLKAVSAEGLYIHTEDVIDGHLTISTALEKLEVRLVEIEIYD